MLARASSGGARSTRGPGRGGGGEDLQTEYRYTLQLPRTQPADPIANFLLERRAGHCEYFASAMAVMLRAIGIPSRLATGSRAAR